MIGSARRLEPGDHQDQNQNTKRRCEHIVDVVETGGDVQKEHQLNSHLSDATL
jgi:hypothetical protein